MYRETKICKGPSNTEQKLWRYMDIIKFLSLLEGNALYFNRLDKFDDPFEGTHTLSYIEKRKGKHAKNQAQTLKEAGVMSKILGYTVEQYIERYDHEKNAAKATAFMREITFVNCWHMNDHESAAMWNLYAPSVGGIAIQTNFSNLRDAFDSADRDVYIGAIRYIDYEKEDFSEGRVDIFTPIMYKRKSYEHEKEIRAFTILKQNQQKEEFGKGVSGISIKVNVAKLIDQIFIAPSAGPHVRTLIEGVIKRYDLEKPVTQSKLNSAALY